MGQDITALRRYAAFISYAHADELMAARLHKALETYPVPKHLRKAGKTTSPVFRDVAELTAAHSLSEKIQEAVRGAKYLIVLCSPAAKASHWVNEEVRLFRELHGDTAILSAIIEGTPETAFPAALTEGGREPLAAALGTDKVGFKLGVTQLAAGMLGTGLDDLIQRGAKRRNRIMGAGLAVSLALSGVLGFTALQAVEARNEAQLERAESEALLDYMVKDLKVKLEPVGRLELLEGVGRKAIEYYNKKDSAALSDDNLRLLAAARQVLAQVALDAGRMEEAQREIEASAALTREVLGRNPEDTDAIYAHAQSEFWVGKYYFNQNKFEEVEPYWRKYNRLSQKLHQIDSNNFDYIMEAAWSANALGAYYDRQRDYINSASEYNKAAKYARLAIVLEPDSEVPKKELANILAGQARSALYIKSFDEIDALRQEEVGIYDTAIANGSKNYDIIFSAISTKFSRYAELIRFQENVEIDKLSSVIQELKVLVDYDSENSNWLRTYYFAQFLRLDYYYKEGDAVNFMRFQDDFFRTQERVLQFTAPNDRYYNFLRDLSHIRYLSISEGQGRSNNAMSILNKKNRNVVGTSLTDIKIDAYLMWENYYRGKKSDAVYFARKYLSYPWVATTEQPPAILTNKVLANELLGECSTANSNAAQLIERNFLVPSIKKSPCL
ncbi:toll/interleukin-1 receptor domain-containing protein [Hellea balneolensis]|uniref:toll/interleukin-1 receptor domain-containing protein n=1 Tax=Hellea balneolensis TaxID=287478 RepID=UPI000408E96C|nr:toll/interleukin-1 receptor domain-containing protein [Hellea balneolensis]